ncbi:MAG: hypothetical protein R3323_01305 [Wenzhouxiangellaceae bacterium]|nr:hypothetical protein [Wenzhouxiangellaceae bacterium]
MFRILSRGLAAALLLGAAQAHAQYGEMNLLTELGTPFPPGCLSIQVPEAPDSPDLLLVDSDLDVPSINSDVPDARVRLRVWRVACADDGFSVVIVRLRQLSGDPVLVPTVWAEAGNVQRPDHSAQLLKVPAAGNVGASSNTVTLNGTSWMLAVDPLAVDGSTNFFPADYNGTFTLEFTWGDFSLVDPARFLFTIDQFEPALDPPQFDQPLLNGRYTGQWIAQGAPRQGLVLQVAELIDTNYVFAIFFTYLNDQPIWVVGNSQAQPQVPGPVAVPMFTLQGGAFIADPSQPPAQDISSSDAGSISISVIDCNTIRVDYDFGPLGFGTGSIDMQRLIRIAGYDCNPWQ